jgi:hypothetical protein
LTTLNTNTLNLYVIYISNYIYYFQPVYVNGLYNNIINYNDNIIVFHLHNIANVENNKIIISPVRYNKYFINNYEIYYNKKINTIKDTNVYIEYYNKNIITVDDAYNYIKYNGDFSIRYVNNIINNNYIYFYKYKNYNKDYNINIGSYHLLISNDNTIQIVTIINQNQFDYNIEGTYLLDKIFKCIVKNDGKFIIENIEIEQLKECFIENKNKVEIIKKYSIEIIEYANKEYNILFNNEEINTNIHNKIYINNKEYDIIYRNNNNSIML